MPRLSPALIRQARSESPLLARLIRVCRDLPSARNELRWLREYVHDEVTGRRFSSHESTASPSRPAIDASKRTDGPNELAGSNRLVRDNDKTTQPTRSKYAFFKVKLPNAIRPQKRPVQHTRTLIKPTGSTESEVKKLLDQVVEDRSQGMPLQYILGNQPFGTLDILCRRGVLIPRPETERYTEKAAKLLVSAVAEQTPSVESSWQKRRKIRILDLCTGSGCIALLIHSILKPVAGRPSPLPAGIGLEILGVDNNPDAVALARANLDHNVSGKLLHPDATHDVSFLESDVRALEKKIRRTDESRKQFQETLNAAAARASGDERLNEISPTEAWDVVLANPPYISLEDYALGGKTESSVRDFEPKNALVPSSDGLHQALGCSLEDAFYPPLIRIARAVGAQLLVMEVGGSSQADRVVEYVTMKSFDSTSNPETILGRLETWRDDEDVIVLPPRTSLRSIQEDHGGTDSDRNIPQQRAVVAWYGALGDWRLQNFPSPNPEYDAIFATKEAHKEPRARHIHRKAYQKFHGSPESTTPGGEIRYLFKD